MIEPMKKVFLIVPTYNKGDMLRALRKAGVLHVIEAQKPKSEKGEALGKTGDNLEKLNALLAEYEDKKVKVSQKAMGREQTQKWTEKMEELSQRRKELREHLIHDEREVSRIKGWGDFDPEAFDELKASGVTLRFYTIGPKELASLPKETEYIALAPVDGVNAIAVLKGDVPGGTRFDIPEQSLSALQKAMEQDTKELESIDKSFKDSLCYVEALHKEQKLNAQEQVFARIGDGVEGDNQLCYLQGYLPAKSVDAFSRVAKANAWGYALEEIEDDDNPPTLLSFKKGVDMMQPIYSILGTLPGYRERDISIWFLMFFTLFFAMIIGDAGYGLIFLIVGIVLHKKGGKATPTVRLLYLLSSATIIWGALTGTWFGSTIILEHIPFLQKLVIPSIANIPELFNVTSKLTQDTMMNFCFLIGTVQLSLACVLNIIYKFKRKNISLMADIGWLMDILALYRVILMLVFSKEINSTLAFGTVGVGFVLVLLFGNQAPGKKFSDGLKEGLGGILPTFLNTISCFSNTMSYIRLFAVGMAGYAIASSFNSMAESVMGIKVVGLIGFAFIVLVGHALNLVMGLLSVIVHGVRLNILEFSNQLGMEWSGYAYDPFRETVKE